MIITQNLGVQKTRHVEIIHGDFIEVNNQGPMHLISFDMPCTYQIFETSIISIFFLRLGRVALQMTEVTPDSHTLGSWLEAGLP